MDLVQSESCEVPRFILLTLEDTEPLRCLGETPYHSAYRTYSKPSCISSSANTSPERWRYRWGSRLSIPLPRHRSSRVSSRTQRPYGVARVAHRCSNVPRGLYHLQQTLGLPTEFTRERAGPQCTRTMPLPFSRAKAGRQQSSVERSWMSR